MTLPSTAQGDRQEVTLLELFFDLVFVFAVTQLAHHLLTHLTWRGAAETGVLLLGVFAVWLFTSWDATIAGVVRPHTRGMVLVVMLLGLFMNSALPQAFAAQPWAFALPFLLIQLGRSLWMSRTAPRLLFRRHYTRTLGWLGATAPLWIIGALAGPAGRLWWWGAAGIADLIGTWLAHPVPGRRLASDHTSFDGDHILERGRLFLLIALGETVLAIGTAVSATGFSWMTLLTGTAALVGTGSLWGLVFGRAHSLTMEHLGRTDDPIRASRLATNVIQGMVAGLFAVAVANELVIPHPYAPSSLSTALLLFGGPTLLLSQGWYLWLLGERSGSVLLGPSLLVTAGLLTLPVSRFVALLVASALLLALASVRGPTQEAYAPV